MPTLITGIHCARCSGTTNRPTFRGLLDRLRGNLALCLDLYRKDPLELYHDISFGASLTKDEESALQMDGAWLMFVNLGRIR